MADALRPLTLGELLDRTFFLYRKHAALFVGLVALPNLATLTLGLAFLPIQQQAQQQFQQQLQRPAGLGFPVVMALFGRMLAPMLVSLVVYLLVLAVSQGATVIAVSRLHLGREASISDSFVGIKGMVVTLCLIMIVVAIGVGLGTILLIVPGILLALRWSLAIPVAALEQTGVRASMSRSSGLTKGHRGRVLVIYFLFLVLIYVLSSLWQIPVMIAVGAFSPPPRGVAAVWPAWAQVATAVGSFLTQVIVGPLLTIALSLVYYDQRVRKEAFDLQHMMSQLDEAAAAAR